MSFQNMTEINLDISQPGLSVVHAKQYDTARKVKVHLFDSGIWWMAPEQNFVAVVAYKKADRIGGFYDHTGDGEVAVTVDGSNRSIVYISLDRQILTTAGNVNVELTFYDSITTGRLSTFSFVVEVEAASLDELDLQSNPYFNVLADDIAAVLQAEANMTGITASVSKLAAGSNPTVTVTGGNSTGNPYNFAFGIPQGDKGDTGDTATPTLASYAYAVSTSGTTVPNSSEFGPSVSPQKGKYYWTRTIVTWSNNQTTTSYAVAYNGIDGSGAVDSVNGQIGNVTLTASDISTSDSNETVQQALDNAKDLVMNIAAFSSLPKTVNNSAITADHVVSQITLGTPEAQTDTWTITTANGSMTLSGNISGSTTAQIVLTKAISISAS